MSPQEAARARLAAIEALQEQLGRAVTEAERELYAGLLARLQDIYDRPDLLPSLLAEFQQLVALPLATYYAQTILTLPTLQADYFTALGVTNFSRIRQPLAAFLEATFGITADGTPTPAGYLATYLNDTGPARALLHYAYTAQAAGLGLSDYRAGLEDLVLGVAQGDVRTKGLYAKLYAEAGDTYNQADRALQGLAADELGFEAALYQGGLIDSSRPFCVARNGKVFLRSEIALFGTSKDKYGGYTDKKAGAFSGKREPYNPAVDAGGYNCRHGYHYIPNLIAINLRPELKEDDKGRLYIAET